MQKELTYKHIWKVSYPLILGGMAQTFINVIDVAFLGRVDETALAASAIATMFFAVLFVPGLGFSIGSQILIARLHGEGKSSSIGNVFNHTLYFILLLALLFFIVSKYWATDILAPLVESEAILEEAVKYLNYRSWGFFLGFAVSTFRAFYAGIADTRVISYATGLMAVANYFLNDIFIFGKLGLPAMGIEGAAIASVISEVIAAIFYVGFTALLFTRYSKYKLLPFSKLNTEEFVKVLRISFPIMLQYFVSLAGWFIFFLIIERMGQTELAVSNVIRSIYGILMIPLMGFGAATNTLVSNLIGQGKQHLVMQLIGRIVLLSFIASLALVGTNLVSPYLGLSVFTNQQPIIEAAIPILYIISGSLLCFSVAMILVSGVSGSGNTMMTLLLECITLGIYLVATYFMAIEWKANLTWVWACEYVYFISMGIGAYIYLKFGNWKNFQLR